MIPHTWDVEEVDGGSMGTDEFWICRRCGASGGLVTTPRFGNNTITFVKSKPFAFLAGHGTTSGKVSNDDCDEAATQIAEMKRIGIK